MMEDIQEFWEEHMEGCFVQGEENLRNRAVRYTCGIQNGTACDRWSCPFLYWLNAYEKSKIKGEI